MKKKNIIGSSVSKSAIIDDNSVIKNSFIGDNVEINNSTITDSTIGESCEIGPYASIKKGSNIGNNCRVGNFVEIKNSEIGDYTKVAHLTYIGDSVVGKYCNIGCGVVFANYDGKQKHKIVIEDGCFIGCNSVLIAPLRIAKGTFICAGCIVTKDTNEKDFVIGRVEPTIKPNRAEDYYKKP